MMSQRHTVACSICRSCQIFPRLQLRRDWPISLWHIMAKLVPKKHSLAKWRHRCHSSISTLLSLGKAVTPGVTPNNLAATWPISVTLVIRLDYASLAGLGNQLNGGE